MLQCSRHQFKLRQKGVHLIYAYHPKSCHKFNWIREPQMFEQDPRIWLPKRVKNDPSISITRQKVRRFVTNGPGYCTHWRPYTLGTYGCIRSPLVRHAEWEWPKKEHSESKEDRGARLEETSQRRTKASRTVQTNRASGETETRSTCTQNKTQ